MLNEGNGYGGKWTGENPALHFSGKPVKKVRPRGLILFLFRAEYDAVAAMNIHEPEYFSQH